MLRLVSYDQLHAVVRQDRRNWDSKNTNRDFGLNSYLLRLLVRHKLYRCVRRNSNDGGTVSYPKLGDAFALIDGMDGRKDARVWVMSIVGLEPIPRKTNSQHRLAFGVRRTRHQRPVGRSYRVERVRKQIEPRFARTWDKIFTRSKGAMTVFAKHPATAPDNR